MCTVMRLVIRSASLTTLSKPEHHDSNGLLPRAPQVPSHDLWNSNCRRPDRTVVLLPVLVSKVLAMMRSGDVISSPAGGFIYTLQGAVCRLFDREELPWPSCSLQWKGKQPSWNRVGCRFVPDMASRRFQSYSVTGIDAWGSEWVGVMTMYFEPQLSKAEARWWYHPRNERQEYPDYVEL